jgi:hypothetical protein
MRSVWRLEGRWRMSERQLARLARRAGGRRYDALSGRRQVRAPWEKAGWAGRVQAGVASGR